MEYKKYNDYELLYFVKENDEFSQKILFEKYQPVLRNLAKKSYRSFSHYGYEYEDFLQEANIAFQQAIRCYNESKSILFYTFVILCVRRKLFTFCREISLRKKNNSIAQISEKDEYSIVDRKSDINAIMDSYVLEEICKKAILNLPMEISSILELRINGFTYGEIGNLLDIPISTVESRFRRAKKYLQQKGVCEKT